MKTYHFVTTTTFSVLLTTLGLVACGGAEVEPADPAQTTGLEAAPAEPSGESTPEAKRRHRDHGPRGEGRRHGPPSPEKLIERFDANKNGMLEAAELPEKMQQHLGDIDTSGDGVVSKEELVAHFKARFAEHAQKRFERKDVNRDGVLDPAELGDKWAKLSVADANGDQKLTPDELKAAFEAGKLKPMGGKHGKHLRHDGPQAPPAP
jgi:hypothetical protein